LKFSIDTGVKTVRAISEDPAFQSRDQQEGMTDLVIVGAGLSGYAAAIEAKKLGLSFQLLESNRPLSTLVNFPKRKPIYTYPREMTPEGDLQVSAEFKEELIAEIEEQIQEHGIEA